jgi:two-component system, LytTR family, sensor kinase
MRNILRGGQDFREKRLAFVLLMKNTYLQKKSLLKNGIIFHLLFWLMYAAFMIFGDLGDYIVRKGVLFITLPLLIYFLLMAILVYGNILFLVPQLLEKKRTVAYIGGLLVFIIGYTWFRSLNQQHWDAIVWPKEPMTVRSYFRWNALYAVWFLLISTLLFYTQKWASQQQQVRNIQITQLQTELKYLRAQVNPHFLFNGLNTIYGNIDMRDQKARDILLQFSDLLRYSLYEADTDLVHLQQEAAWLENYVALQRARSDSSLQIDLVIDIGDGYAQIAPLLFMAFVENAFKFATHDEDRVNVVSIRLAQKNGQLTFECSNTAEEQEQASGGIGLSNARRRLDLLYHDRHTLTIRQDQNSYFVQLILML